MPMADLANHPTRINSLFNRPLTQTLFLLGCLVVLGINFVTFGIKLKENRAARVKNPYIFLGYKFLGLNQILGPVDRIGYITDKNIDDRVNAMEFAQAEYTLVPITLDLNNPDHEYLILACTSPEIALAMSREMGWIPLKQNAFGIILAQNPRGGEK